MPLVIGISGATRSGKSTLAAALAEHFGSKTVVLHQDSFASHALAARHESGWEATESIDHARLRAALAKHVTAKSAPKVIIVEGFRALHDPELVAAMTVLCWIDVSREVCRARKTPVNAEAFETYVWPRHEEYREFCFSSAGPFGEATASKHQTRLVLNGERTTVTLVQQVLAAITARKDVKSIAVQPSPRAAIKPTAAVQPSARAVER